MADNEAQMIPDTVEAWKAEARHAKQEIERVRDLLQSVERSSDTLIWGLRAAVERLTRERDGAFAVVKKAQDWHTSRTEYLIECEIALSSHAPLEGGTKYRAHAAASAMAASDLVVALNAYAAIRALENPNG